MSKSKKSFFEPGAYERLERIEYTGFETTQPGKGIKVVSSDMVEVLGADKKQFSVRVTRSVRLDPQFAFEARVSYIIRRVFKKGITDDDIEFVTSDILKDPERYIAPVFASLSSVIAQVTHLSGETPVITPPNVSATLLA